MDEITLQPYERAKPLPRWIPWWLSLLITGESAPRPDSERLANKRWWLSFGSNTAEATQCRMAVRQEAASRFAELSASSLDVFVKLSILSSVFGSIAGITAVLATGTIENQLWSWWSLGFLTIALLSTLALILPKLKEWWAGPEDTEKIGSELIKAMYDGGWLSWQRMLDRIHHRSQLLILERREKFIAIFGLIFAWICVLKAFGVV